MKSKKILSLTLCLAMMLCTVACRSADDTYSSNLTQDDTTSTESYKDVELIEDNNSFVSSTPAASNESDTTTSKDDVSNVTSDNNSNEETSGNDVIEMLYGFSSIKNVSYYCAKNLPNSDIIYSISSIITNKDTDIVTDTSVTISCNDKNVKVDGTTVTIPASYAKSGKLVKFTARHSGVGAKYDFTIKPDAKWDLVFEDNFDGTTLNTDVWNVWDEMRDWRYSYSKDNIFLDGKGNLINRMSVSDDYDAETGEGRFTGAITTLDKFEQTYGYYEIRMIPNLTSGLWSAYWLVGGDMSDKDAADDGTSQNGFEVDIVETYYYRTDPAQTIHWDGYYNDQTKSKSFSFPGMSEIFDGNYHTFGFRWSPEEYSFFIDGKLTAKTKEMGICDQPAYMLVSAHFGNAGEMVMQPGEYSDMIVDYVKVYSSSDDAK